eukprot:scaffold1104_cov299-Prasinococcus_capsulatus_cf.AAC.16
MMSERRAVYSIPTATRAVSNSLPLRRQSSVSKQASLRRVRRIAVPACGTLGWHTARDGTQPLVSWRSACRGLLRPPS